MKTICVALFLFFSLGAVSNDTLTRAQVYNFNVGDTFDYWYLNASQGYDGGDAWWYDTSYAQYVVTAVYYSTNMDTLYIGWKRNYPLPVYLDTLIIDSLNQYEYLSYFNNCQPSIIDTSTYYNDRNLNSICDFEGEGGQSERFAAGLGTVYYYQWGGDSYPDGYMEYAYQLIYYSNGNEKWGTPYKIAGGDELIHYTPIPEECATWVRTVHYANALNEPLVIQEKITEGNKIAFNGHVYIELLYSYYNYYDTISGTNSMIGYLRNDTLNQSAYLYDSLGGSAVITYDFKTQAGENYICSISQVMVGADQRAEWNPCPSSDLTNYGMIEGVGGRGGIWPVQFTYYIPSGEYPPYFLPDQLTCFSVCGTVLYPVDSEAVCDFITSVKEVPPPTQIQLFPNPSTGTWQLTVDEDLLGNKLLVYDAEGRLIFQSEIRNPKSEISFNAAPGVYFLQIASPQVNVVRKLVKL